MDAYGMPVRMLVTAGTVADCTRAVDIIEGITAEYLPADWWYDTNGMLLAAAREHGMPPVLPRRGRKEPQSYGASLYQVRHPVENGFCQL